MKLDLHLKSILKRGNAPILLLLSLTVASRLILILDAPFVYYFDSYTYMRNAIDFATQSQIQLSVGAPFVMLLGIFFYVFGSIFDVIFVSRLLMLLTTVLLAYVVYSLGFKMAGKTFGFFAGLVAIFEPYSLSFSIVPHSDIFAVTIGLTALYFATSSKKSLQILSPILFYIALFTKSELYPILLIPIMILYLHKNMKNLSKKRAVVLVLGIAVYILPAIWLFTIVPARTRFDLFEKIGLFLTPELMMNTLDKLFRFSNEAFLNHAVFVLLWLGMLLALLSIFADSFSLWKSGKLFSIKHGKKGNLRDIFSSEGVIVGLSLLLLCLVCIVVVTVYGYGYVISEGNLTILKSLPERYLILPRLLLSYPLAYTLFVVVKKAHAEFAHKA